MNTIKKLLVFIFLSIFAGVVLESCSKASYKKTKGGMPYQLFRGKGNQQIKNGDFIKFQITQKIKDSVYFTTEGLMPQYQIVSDQTRSSYDISELWTSLKVGDSVVTTQLIDTFMKRNPQNFPAKFKKGDKIMTYIKVIGIFASDSLARLDFEKEKVAFGANEMKVIEKYLADKKITAKKTPSGVYVEILTPGTGSPVDSGNYVSVNYTGTSWSGKKFDSNVDSSFGHVQPLSFVVNNAEMQKGFDEAVESLRMGDKARAYIASTLMYGGNPPQGSAIKPFENVIFDLEVTDVKTKKPADPVPVQQQGSPQPDARQQQ